VLAVDRVRSRLEMAQGQGAEVVNFEEEDPVEALKRLTAGIGVDRAIDAVGVDAETAHHGKAARAARKDEGRFDRERQEVAPEADPQAETWKPGEAPSQVLDWAVGALAKAGTLAIVGVYPETLRSFPIGNAMEKNLTVQMGNCNHRKYLPHLVELVVEGVIDPTDFLTQVQPLVSAIEAYESFDRREEGWMKVMLEPAAVRA
jgi:threonine dehydrogenase-like Zn-dependent dehydrogenase